MTRDELVAELVALRTRAEKAEQFREAVMDALVVSCIYTAEHDANPRKAINDLLAWESQIALDPAVSSDAQALIDQGRADLAEVKKERDTLRTSTDELRRAIADLIGADPETWPNHGNAPLAIAAGFALAQNRAEKAEAELAEMRRLYKGVCDACEIATNAGIAQRERAEKAEQFREAVMDALVVSHIYVPEHDTNPRKAINDLICWEQKIALDPAVSSDARALIERAVAGCAEDCAIQVAAREKAEQENARLREALAWRPIETAPQNQRVLIYYANSFGKGRRIIATYYPAETLDSEYTESEYADEGWYEESYANEEIYPVEAEPSLWLPLPEPPAARTALLDEANG